MSKVIFKLTFKHPNFKDTVSKNISHVKYISTRSGVDKTLTEADLQKELEKGIENITSEDETYIKYIDERPRSHGLFGQDGIEDPKDVQDEISNVSSYVWRGIVSLKEEDANNLGYLSKDKWQDMLRKMVPDIGNEMGIGLTNLRWVGAVHMEKGHPHAHVMIWEKEPKRTVGLINNKALNRIRKLLTDEIFEEQRQQLLIEKNAMRDLIKELAEGDVSKTAILLKEINATGLELKAFFEVHNQVGLAPKLYSEDEQAIADMIKNLAGKMPGKGRVAFKFMPEDVKDEVRHIADYLLLKPEFCASLEKNLKAVEELTKMYTSNEEDIQKARDNAYKDMRDRVCQVVLKGASESQRENIFYVDTELSLKAVDFIKNINNKIDLEPERSKVLNEISIALIRTGHSDEQMNKFLMDFQDKENFNLTKEYIENIINLAKGNNAGSQDVNTLSSVKKVDYYLSVLKSSGHVENEAFNILRDTIKKNSLDLNNKLLQFVSDGILKIDDGQYKLTNKGVEEFLKVKELDGAEKVILKMLEGDDKVIPEASFKVLLDNKDVFSNLYDKDPEEFIIGKYDIKVREVFGDNNAITFKELEEKIYEKYTDVGPNINTDKADVEIEILEKRIEKLALNGYVKFDRVSGVYSFTDETDSYFTYDDNDESYYFTDEAKAKFNIKNMEFTRYDANVTLGYIDRAENNVLTENDLKNTLHKEIVNQTAKNYYESFMALLESGQADKYICINENGDISSTEEGKNLGRELNQLNRYFYQCNGVITEDKLKIICNKEFGDDAERQFEGIIKLLDRQVEKGNININNNTSAYSINPIVKNTNNLLYQIYKEGGSLNKNMLKDILEKNIPNKEADNQFKYLSKKLRFLKSEGYLNGNDGEYTLNFKGIEKRADLLMPQRDLLRDKLSYLERLGLIQNISGGKYQATDKYYSYMKSIAKSKEDNVPRISNVISKDIAAIIDRTQDKVDIGKIERTNLKIATGKYINGDYTDIKTDYESMRTFCNVTDTIANTLKNISAALFVSGVSLEDTKDIIHKWNIGSNSNINPEKLNEIIDKSYGDFKNNNLWGKITLISTKDWKDMFNAFGVNDNNIPQWIYKGYNWQALNKGVGLGSIVNDVWKSLWRTLERQRMQNEAQANMMKQQMIKQQAASQSKEAIKEQIIKNRDNIMYRDDELEL